MARLLKIEESKKTSGNFWSSRLEIEFTYDIESAKNENTIKAKNHAKAEIEGLKTYREKANQALYLQIDPVGYDGNNALTYTYNPKCSFEEYGFELYQIGC